jgi:adenylate cyclase, class 1
MPLLLHENIKFLGGTEFDETIPHGIEVYQNHLGKTGLTARYAAKNYIQGLFIISSVGSLAQTSDSDIDYWVYINEDNFSKSVLSRLQKKLETIEKLSWTEFKIQIPFFIVGITRARNNDFSGSTIESSGSAQSRILKEEFYRTMIHVAGKIPLWAVLLTAISLNRYNNILKKIESYQSPPRYIDLGDIHAISTSEFLALQSDRCLNG